MTKARPKQPLKTNAFVYSEKCCRAHAFVYEEYPGDNHVLFGDLFNTAEESLPYCYEMSRNAGQNAGFVVDLESLESLVPETIDTLILPPLTDVTEKERKAIRRLHERGVALLGFEEVEGLEDLFGVETGTPVQVGDIHVNTELAKNPLKELNHLTEHTNHQAARGKYRSDGATILLDAETPVLFSHQSRWGRTALFNIPPTVVRRQDQPNRVSAGRDSISELINRSTQLILKYLSDPVVEVSEGKVIGFEDENGDRRIIVEQDSWPEEAKTIRPLLTINLPNLNIADIQSDHEFSIASHDEQTVQIRLKLGESESRSLKIPGTD